MLIMKFGGTSVADAAAILNVSQIVQRHLLRKPVVVASACAGVTDSLLTIANEAVHGQARQALDRVEDLRGRHLQVAAGLLLTEGPVTVTAQVNTMMDELRDLVKSIAILGELTARSLDIFVSFGERLSTLLLCHRLVLDGVNAVLVSARDLVVTNNEFTKAQPLMDEIVVRANTLVIPMLDAGHVVVTQGFLGGTRDGIPTTLGRGGSDYTAAILGAALGAEEIQIWTDVDGIMTCDPSLIDQAHLIGELTFREAAELAYFGARVLHPATIQPAVTKNIPVRVLNSMRPDSAGTVIVRESKTNRINQPVTAIAFKAGISLINIDSTRMLMTHGFLAKVFEVFARYQKSVDVIATSEVSISLTVDDESNLEAICDDLRLIAEVEVSSDQAIFCVVGENIKTSRSVLARVFSTLDRHDIPVGLISLGASEINMTFVVNAVDIARTARALHDEFFGISRAPS